MSDTALEPRRTNRGTVLLLGGVFIALLVALVVGLVGFLHRGEARDLASAADCRAAQSILDQTRTTPIGPTAVPYGRRLEAETSQIKNGTLADNIDAYALRKSLIAAGKAAAPNSQVMKGTRENINYFCDPALDIPPLA